MHVCLGIQCVAYTDGRTWGAFIAVSHACRSDQTENALRQWSCGFLPLPLPFVAVGLLCCLDGYR